MKANKIKRTFRKEQEREAYEFADLVNKESSKKVYPVRQQDGSLIVSAIKGTQNFEIFKTWEKGI